MALRAAHLLTCLESQRHRWGLSAILTSDLRFKFSFTRDTAILRRFQPAIHRRKAKLVFKRLRKRRTAACFVTL